MSQTQSRMAWTLVLLLGAGVCVGFTYPFNANVAQDEKSKPVEKLLPANAVVYVGADGRDAHKEDFEKTAAYEAIYKSGLSKVFGKVVNYAFGKIGGDAGGLELFKKTYGTISGKGLSLVVSVKAGDAGPPKPWVILVLHEGADLEAGLGGIVRKFSKERLVWETRTVSGRMVTRANIPVPPGAPFKPEVGWWKEGGHLVIAGGVDAVDSAIAVATGRDANITTNPLWKKYRGGKTDFAVSTVAWIDTGSLRTMFGRMPVPSPGREKPSTVNDFLKAAGLANLNAIVSRSGYRGKATWSETRVEAPGPRTGLLSLLANKPMTVHELPPLPAHASNFYAASVDFSKSYTAILDVVRKIAKLGPPGAGDQVEGALDQLPAIIGFDPKTDLLDAFGNVMCVYDDAAQGPFGFGSGLLVQVKDAKKLRKMLNRGLEVAADKVPGGQFKVLRTKKHGRELVTAEIAGGVFHLCYVVTDDWFCLAAYPQTVESFLLRLDKKLPVWKPSLAHREGLKQLPEKFTAISITDPKRLYRLVVGLAPVIYSFAKIGLKQAGVGLDDFPVALSDLPPAEMVTHPLFPNISVTTVDREGVRCLSRSSLPGIFGADTVTVSAVAVALLLPAVQQAREAARRSASKNNLKQIALALHNYHDTYGQFPYGTSQKNKKLKPNERLSWQATILPFIEQNPLYRKLDFKKGWEEEPNEDLMKPIPTYENPGVVSRKTDFGATHYVGMAGLGKNSLTTTKIDKKVGIFGYNRRTRIRDITDGTSNTIMTAEASKNYGAWGAGGSATVRAWTKKPYINGPDGIGGPWSGGFHVGLADGSVRFISNKIDPSILEKLATMAGGEVVGEF
ncbi:MAG: DUF1559 domain-containing protein [Planctomycetaceae bacterium]